MGFRHLVVAAVAAPVAADAFEKMKVLWGGGGGGKNC